MKAYIKGFIYSLPIQLLLLHIRRYQVLLLFWFILFGAIDGIVMKAFGAYSLFLVPEYLGDVNTLAWALTGIASGVFYYELECCHFYFVCKAYPVFGYYITPVF
ncbi:MAG: hypothetical protein ABUT20_55580 [Bacteroidota bacterium]